MADQISPPRIGNPNWFPGMPSPNPRGRPRAGLAAVEKVRELVDPKEWVVFALSVANDVAKPASERLNAWHALIDRGYVHAPKTLDMNVNPDRDDEPDLRAATDDELAQLEELDRRRRHILDEIASRSLESSSDPIALPAPEQP